MSWDYRIVRAGGFGKNEYTYKVYVVYYADDGITHWRLTPYWLRRLHRRLTGQKDVIDGWHEESYKFDFITSQSMLYFDVLAIKGGLLRRNLLEFNAKDCLSEIPNTAYSTKLRVLDWFKKLRGGRGV